MSTTIETFENPTATVAIVWGDGRCPDLDRFAPPNSILESTDYPEAGRESGYQSWLAWWESASEPWCVYVDCPDKATEDDLVRTCDQTPNVAGYLFLDE